MNLRIRNIGAYSHFLYYMVPVAYPHVNVHIYLYYSKSEHLFQDYVNQASFSTNDIFFLSFGASLIYKVWYLNYQKKDGAARHRIITGIPALTYIASEYS
jgi:hypothetical protein